MCGCGCVCVGVGVCVGVCVCVCVRVCACVCACKRSGLAATIVRKALSLRPPSHAPRRPSIALKDQRHPSPWSWASTPTPLFPPASRHAPLVTGAARTCALPALHVPVAGAHCVQPVHTPTMSATPAASRVGVAGASYVAGGRQHGATRGVSHSVRCVVCLHTATAAPMAWPTLSAAASVRRATTAPRDPRAPHSSRAPLAIGAELGRVLRQIASRAKLGERRGCGRAVPWVVPDSWLCDGDAGTIVLLRLAVAHNTNGTWPPPQPTLPARSLPCPTRSLIHVLRNPCAFAARAASFIAQRAP